MWRKGLFWLALAMPIYGQSIREFILDPRRVIELPVSAEITTLTWPGGVSSVAAAVVLIDDGTAQEVEVDEAARFHVVHADGSNFILVRSLKPDAEATLAVMFDNAAYVIKLKTVATDPVASAILKTAEVSSAERVNQLPQPVQFSPTIGLSLLDRARLYPILARSLPKAVQDVEVVRPENMKSDWAQMDVMVDEVYRFHREDALVFLVKIRNKTDRALTLAPSTFAVRVGEEKFTAAIANSPRRVEPGQVVDAEFAVVGMPDGTRNDVSVRNLFTVSVNTVAPDEIALATHPGEGPKS